MSLASLSEATLGIWAKIDDICGENAWAHRWLTQALSASQVWDNCVDEGDNVDAAMADRVFMALLTEWPMNPWFNQHKGALVPVMVNAISAWRFSDVEPKARQRAYDVGSELICTTAFLIGGQPLVDKHMPAVRALCLKAQEANDTIAIAK